MGITTHEWNGLGFKQTCEHGIASGLTRLHCGRFKRGRLLVGRYVLPALCAIAIGLGGCSTAATAPGRQDTAAAASDTARPVCPATLYAGETWYPNQEEFVCNERPPEQPPGSCLTDYFFSTKRPLCTAVDWLVVLPVVLSAALIIGGAWGSPGR
jgi:hypothetical protein